MGPWPMHGTQSHWIALIGLGSRWVALGGHVSPWVALLVVAWVALSRLEMPYRSVTDSGSVRNIPCSRATLCMCRPLADTHGMAPTFSIRTSCRHHQQTTNQNAAEPCVGGQRFGVCTNQQKKNAPGCDGRGPQSRWVATVPPWDAMRTPCRGLRPLP
jgi:hypothetical protein